MDVLELCLRGAFLHVPLAVMLRLFAPRLDCIQVLKAAARVLSLEAPFLCSDSFLLGPEALLLGMKPLLTLTLQCTFFLAALAHDAHLPFLFTRSFLIQPLHILEVLSPHLAVLLLPHL